MMHHKFYDGGRAGPHARHLWRLSHVSGLITNIYFFIANAHAGEKEKMIIQVSVHRQATVAYLSENLKFE